MLKVDALWRNTPVTIIRDTGPYVTVRFLAASVYFERGEVVTLSDYNLVFREPVRRPVYAVKRQPPTAETNGTPPTGPPRRASSLVVCTKDISSVEDVYERLHRYVRWLAGQAQRDHILLRADEIEGELYEQLTYGWLYYKDRDLSDGELLAVIRRILDNRVSELLYRFYYTHRQAEAYAESFESMSDAGVLDNTSEYIASGVAKMQIEHQAEFSQTLTDFYAMLTPDESRIVDALLNSDPRVGRQLMLKAQRRSVVYNNPTVVIDYRVVAKAIHMPVDKARRLWYSIREKWRQVYDE